MNTQQKISAPASRQFQGLSISFKEHGVKYLHQQSPRLKSVADAILTGRSLNPDPNLKLGLTKYNKLLWQAQECWFCFSHQGICPLEGKLLVITDPAPKARHDDAYAFKHHCLDR